MIVKSETTGITYDDKEMVFFRNYIQAANYINWGAKLIDIFTDSKCKLVFVFEKTTHEKLRERWGTKIKDEKCFEQTV